MTIRNEKAVRSGERSGAGARPARSRLWTVLGVAAVLSFVAGLVVLTRNAAVPVGALGNPAMSMSTGATSMVQLTLRTVDGRSVQLPGGRPGIVVFVDARRCDSCVAAVRVAAAAVRAEHARAAVTVINVDSSTSRDDVARFARAAGRPPVRYVVDDRMGTLVSTLGASTLAAMIVYDTRGRVVARPGPVPAQLVEALRRASR